MVLSPLLLSCLLPRLWALSTAYLHSGSLFLEVWSGEGNLHVRLEGEAKIKTIQDPQGWRLLLNVLYAQDSPVHQLVLSLTS